MKKLKLKNMVLAAALAMGLGLTGIAATAQAAEEGAAPRTECEHPWDKWQYVDTFFSYDPEDISIFYHKVYIFILYTCGECGVFVYDEEEVMEPHNLVYNYLTDRYECTHCDYWE